MPVQGKGVLRNYHSNAVINGVEAAGFDWQQYLSNDLNAVMVGADRPSDEIIMPVPVENIDFSRLEGTWETDYGELLLYTEENEVGLSIAGAYSYTGPDTGTYYGILEGEFDGNKYLFNYTEFFEDEEEPISTGIGEFLLSDDGAIFIGHYINDNTGEGEWNGIKIAN